MLSNKGYRITGRSLLIFTPVEGWEPPEADWIFFSSPRAVQFFFRGLPAGSRRSLGKLAAIGKGTAAALEEQGMSCAFTGTGDPVETAGSFLPLVKGKRVLFPQAERSRRTVQRHIAAAGPGQGTAPRIEDLVVYTNQTSKSVPVQPFDILVFTSPLNVKAWYTKKPIESHQHVVAIGDSTRRALEETGLPEVLVSPDPSEKSLAEVVLEIGEPG